MSDYKGYNFNVQIWEEDEKFNWAVTEEFECETKEFLPIGWGTADSYEEAAEAAGVCVRQVF
jgi:hypothetical protein